MPFNLGAVRLYLHNSNLCSVLSDSQRLEDYQRRLDTSNLKLSEYPDVEELRVRNGPTMTLAVKCLMTPQEMKAPREHCGSALAFKCHIPMGLLHLVFH